MGFYGPTKLDADELGGVCHVMRRVSEQGWTPLHHACCAGRNSAVAYLLDKKADVNADNKNKETPLHLAFGNGHMEIIRLLMQVLYLSCLSSAKAPTSLEFTLISG
jgi:hypothetical protein